MSNTARINSAVEDMRRSLNIMYVLLCQNMPHECGDEDVDAYISKAKSQIDDAVQNFHSAEQEIRLAMQESK